MKIKKTIALILCIAVLFALCGCNAGNSAEVVSKISSAPDRPKADNDVIALASTGEITELPVKIGTDIQSVVSMIIENGTDADPTMIDGDLMRYEMNMETSLGEETAPLFFYQKGKKDMGISILVSTSEAYGLMCGAGTDADDIINWVGKDVTVERGATTEEDVFFNDFIPLNNMETLKYQAGDYILKFIVDNNLYESEDGQEEVAGLYAVTLTNPAALDEE